MNERTPIFVISVAAELANMHPQTLRQYDRLGLVCPNRTIGQSRRYSLHDIAQLREVARLSALGVSLEGIRRILGLEDEISELRDRVRELESALADEMLNRPGRRVFAAGVQGNVISLQAGKRVRRETDLVVWNADPRRFVALHAIEHAAEIVAQAEVNDA